MPDNKGYCKLFMGNRVHNARHQMDSVCVEADTCWDTDKNDPEKEWRCDAWTPPATRFNYKDNLDRTQLAKYLKDMADTEQDSRMARSIKSPVGWTSDNYIGLDDLGISDFIYDELERD